MFVANQGFQLRRKYNYEDMRKEVFTTKADWLSFKRKFAQEERVIAGIINQSKKTKNTFILKALINYKGVRIRSFIREMLSTRQPLWIAGNKDSAALFTYRKKEIDEFLRYVKHTSITDIAIMLSMKYDEVIRLRNYLIIWKAVYDKTVCS